MLKIIYLVYFAKNIDIDLCWLR